MKYKVTTWETLECIYEVEAADKDDAWKRVLDHEGKQIHKVWKENGSYLVEANVVAGKGKPEFPGDVIDFKAKVLEIMRKKNKPIDKEE
mgnify:CR=1 FL=1